MSLKFVIQGCPRDVVGEVIGRDKGKSGRRIAALSQGLTRNIGYPKLREHLGAVIAYMTMSKNYFDFIDKLDRFRPKHGQIPLPFDYEPDPADDGASVFETKEAAN